jgi:hypothetical protein
MGAGSAIRASYQDNLFEGAQFMTLHVMSECDVACDDSKARNANAFNGIALALNSNSTPS